MTALERGKVTYTTATVKDDDFHRAFEEAGRLLLAGLGARVPEIVGGEEQWPDPAVLDVYPAATDVVVAEVPESGPAAVDRAVTAARAVFRGAASRRRMASSLSLATRRSGRGAR